MIKTVFIDGKNKYVSEDKITYKYYFTSDFYDFDTRKTTITRHIIKSEDEYNIGDEINVRWNKEKFRWEIVNS